MTEWREKQERKRSDHARNKAFLDLLRVLARIEQRVTSIETKLGQLQVQAQPPSRPRACSHNHPDGLQWVDDDEMGMAPSPSVTQQKPPSSSS